VNNGEDSLGTHAPIESSFFQKKFQNFFGSSKFYPYLYHSLKNKFTMKNFKLNEEQFILLTANTNCLRNHFISEMNRAEHQEVKDFYQREIDRINDLFDSLNSSLNCKF
jgi:hypothetical protein